MKKLLFLILFLFPILVFSQDSIKKPNSSVISLDKVKVVYRGVDNPITIAVPNAKSYTVSGAGVITTNEVGKYIVRPGSGKEMTIKVEIILNDDTVVVEEHVYQIKGLPSLLTTINNQFSSQGYLEFTLEELKEAEVGIKLIDFLFPQYPIVNEFTIKIPNKEPYINEGNILSEEAYKLIKEAKKKDLIIITNVKCFFSGVSQLNKPSSSIVIKIIK